MSSRIPDGVQNHCPLCRADVRVDKPVGHGETTCPACKAGLWYIKGESGAKLYDLKAVNGVREPIAKILHDKLGTDPAKVTYQAAFIQDLGADSLDIVELVMGLEEAFEITIPDDQAEKLKTVGDAVTYILEHKPAG